MRYNTQRIVAEPVARLRLDDESVYLRGSAPQAVGIDGSEAGAASPGARFTLVNDCDHDATFAPDPPQTARR